MRDTPDTLHHRLIYILSDVVIVLLFLLLNRVFIYSSLSSFVCDVVIYAAPVLVLSEVADVLLPTRALEMVNSSFPFILQLVACGAIVFIIYVTFVYLSAVSAIVSFVFLVENVFQNIIFTYLSCFLNAICLKNVLKFEYVMSSVGIFLEKSSPDDSCCDISLQRSLSLLVMEYLACTKVQCLMEFATAGEAPHIKCHDTNAQSNFVFKSQRFHIHFINVRNKYKSMFSYFSNVYAKNFNSYMNNILFANL